MIVLFLEGNFPDYNNRFLSHIWAYNYEQMENIHDYIQWVFPLDTASNSVLDAPALTFEEIKESKLALENLLKSKRWFIKFLGNSDNWISDSNHNHRRISRMIKSIRLLHGDEEANICLLEILNLARSKGFQGTQSIKIWKKC